MAEKTLDLQSETQTDSLIPSSEEIRSEREDISLLDLGIVLLRGKKTIAYMCLFFLVAATIFAYLIMKPMYTGQAVFLPPQNPPGSGMAQFLNQLGSLGSVGSLATGLKGTGDIYVGILGSRTVTDDLIRKFDLQKVYHAKRFSDAEKILQKRSSFVVAKNTLVTIKVEDHDAKRAADLANAYLEDLREQNGRLALTEAGQRRLFFEQQLEREKNALADAEVEMKKVQEKTGLISPNGQAQVQIEEMAQLRAQITSREVELASLRTGATDQNPQVIQLQTQIAGLEQQLQRLQNDTGRHKTGSIELSTAKVPELALEYVRRNREVKYHEVLFELLAKQYESARLDESRNAPILQVIDSAVIPERKSSLPRAFIVAVGAFLGALIGVAYVLAKHFLTKIELDPETAAKLKELRRSASLTDIHS